MHPDVFVCTPQFGSPLDGVLPCELLVEIDTLHPLNASDTVTIMIKPSKRTNFMVALLPSFEIFSLSVNAFSRIATRASYRRNYGTGDRPA